MKISELASRVSVTRDTIRHYVSMGLLVPERDPANGYQIFGVESLSRLQFIKTARQLGFGLGDIQQIFRDAEGGSSPCPRVRDLMRQRIAETRQTICELSVLCDRMESSVADWDSLPDCVPTGQSVCRLIESQMPTEKQNFSPKDSPTESPV